MLAGFNCTIFAYGQTGTGKTYTMSGDVAETLGILSDQAGIIPRVLKALFDKLQVDAGENCVKVSFIELYNEELRDLISVEESAKLKIYDDVKKGHATTVVQGMEEKHINSASEGITVLQEGSLKRQVAATKCNDLSSRSHTVFAITAYVRIPGENGAPDELVSAGKLNLVDLAGSENIQRSGAENKRAAEAGLINKSLLTLGRVINALVDRSAHIPYRESKLTRLLQDSLGGRTKTCIIATVSPAKSNLEETISTLDYAFRAKNIRNRPRINQPINKKALLRDFANEIERLKTELICHRQRSGVYLSNEAYEELAGVNESRRIMLEEHAEKLETVETSLRNKAQELLMLTATFMGLKKEHEGVRIQLDEKKEVLDQVELVLAATRHSLAEETHLRKAHQRTEEQLVEVGGKLISTLKKTVGDVDGLRAKSKRKSDVQALNRTAWASSQAQVADATELVEERVLRLRDEQAERIEGMAGRMRGFVDEELRQLSETQTFLEDQLAVFGESKRGLLERGDRSKEDMDGVLEEIKVVRDSVKERVGESLQAISGAAERISNDVLSELDTFHNQLHTSYSALGKDFKTIFEDLTRHLVTQRSESERLRRQLQNAARTMMSQSDALSKRIQDVVEEERRAAAEDRQTLMAQIGALVNAQAEAQESRLAEKAALLRKDLRDASEGLGSSVETYDEAMGAWDEKEGKLLEDVKESRDVLKTKLKDDWNVSFTVIYLGDKGKGKNGDMANMGFFSTDGERPQQLDTINGPRRPRTDGPRRRRADLRPGREDGGAGRLRDARAHRERAAPRRATRRRDGRGGDGRGLLRQHRLALQDDVRAGEGAGVRDGGGHGGRAEGVGPRGQGDLRAACGAEGRCGREGAEGVRAHGHDAGEDLVLVSQGAAAYGEPRGAARGAERGPGPGVGHGGRVAEQAEVALAGGGARG